MQTHSLDRIGKRILALPCSFHNMIEKSVYTSVNQTYAYYMSQAGRLSVICQCLEEEHYDVRTNGLALQGDVPDAYTLPTRVIQRMFMHPMAVHLNRLVRDGTLPPSCDPRRAYVPTTLDQQLLSAPSHTKAFWLMAKAYDEIRRGHISQGLVAYGRDLYNVICIS